MERKFYHTDFEELIKEKADQYKMYPSDRVWKGIDRAIRSKRKWYWSGFVILLTGISYLAITELMSPSVIAPVQKAAAPEQKPAITAQHLNPLIRPAIETEEGITSDFRMEEDGAVTAAFKIPLTLLPGAGKFNSDEKAAVSISGLAPLKIDELYNIELSWPVDEKNETNISRAETALEPLEQNINADEKVRIHWLSDDAAFKTISPNTKRIS